MLPTGRRPTHPGEILLEEFLVPLGMTQQALADKTGMSEVRINTLIKGKRGVTAETAWLLSDALGTSAQFWLNLQNAVDLYDARERLAQA